MKSTARFSVDPRLSALLGESYTSSERALRELVDNAWDAEARVVKITLPDTTRESLNSSHQPRQCHRVETPQI